MKNTNEVQNFLLSSNMLHFLLTNDNLKDFIVTNIHQVFLWPNIDFKPFNQACNHVTNLLKNNCDNKIYSQFLKHIGNLYVGMLSFSPHHHPTSHLIGREDFNDLTQMKHLISTQNLTPDVILANLKMNRSYINSSHNHFLIVQESRLIFLKMYLSLISYLEMELGSCNCDGLLAISTFPLKKLGS